LSAAEGLLIAASRLAASLDAPRPECFKAVSEAALGKDEFLLPQTFVVPCRDEFVLLCLYAAEMVAAFEYDIVGAAIKTEAMMMALRPPPDGTMISGYGMWALTGSRRRLTLTRVKEAAMVRARSQARHTGFPIWLERRATSQDTPSATATRSPRKAGAPSLRDYPGGAELIARIIALVAAKEKWPRIVDLMTDEFPGLAGAEGFNKDRVRGIWRRERSTEHSRSAE
jgi:hypothetical protein